MLKMDSLKRKSEDDINGDKKIRVDEDALLRVKGYHADRKGERDEMQDAHTLLDEFNCGLVKNEIRRVAYYAVFDGHAGSRASRFAAENLHRNWMTALPAGSNLATLEQNLKRCFIEAYKKTDDQFLGQAVKEYVVHVPVDGLHSKQDSLAARCNDPQIFRKPVWKDGTTATALFIINNSVYVTNLGDSRAILCRYKPEENKELPIVLTKDHNPTIFEERMRIQKAGGTVKDGRIMGVSQVSRSIGDGPFKNYGVTCVPDIKKCALTPNDRYVLIACDGLWNAFDNKQVVDYIAELRQQIWKDEKLLETEDKPVNDLRWETLCQRLTAEAIRKGTGDNVTVLLIVIGIGESGDQLSSVVPDQLENPIQCESKEIEKEKKWNMLRRKSNHGSPNLSPTITAGDSSKRRAFSSLGGGSLSPRISFDSAKKHFLQFRRQTTIDAGNDRRSMSEQKRPSMSIVARDWDSVQHKVHDPESDVGGVYVGDEESEKRNPQNSNKHTKDYHQAFSAMKISESTDHKICMIDD